MTTRAERWSSNPDALFEVAVHYHTKGWEPERISREVIESLNVDRKKLSDAVEVRRNRVGPKLEPSEVERALSLYRGGESIGCIKTLFDSTYYQVRKVLLDSGVEIRGQPHFATRRFNLERQKRIAHLYLQGFHVDIIAEKEKLAENTVKQILRQTDWSPYEKWKKITKKEAKILLEQLRFKSETGSKWLRQEKKGGVTIWFFRCFDNL